MLVKYLLAFSLRTCIKHRRTFLFQARKFTDQEYFKQGIWIEWKWSMLDRRNRLPTREMVSNEGVPSKSVIKSSWCTTFFPGKSGFPVNTSANMQPILQISIAGVYCIQSHIIWMWERVKIMKELEQNFYMLPEHYSETIRCTKKFFNVIFVLMNFSVSILHVYWLSPGIVWVIILTTLNMFLPASPLTAGRLVPTSTESLSR